MVEYVTAATKEVEGEEGDRLATAVPKEAQ